MEVSSATIGLDRSRRVDLVDWQALIGRWRDDDRDWTWYVGVGARRKTALEDQKAQHHGHLERDRASLCWEPWEVQMPRDQAWSGLIWMAVGGVQKEAEALLTGLKCLKPCLFHSRQDVVWNGPHLWTFSLASKVTG